MVPVILLLFVIALSLLITRTAASALVLTGLSRDSARFQARSAYCGVGFTTNESESITRHPVRRRIIMMLMLLGNAGIATVVATVILSVANPGRAHWSQSLAVVGIGLLIIGAIANSRFIDHHMTRVIEWALRRFTRLDVRDYTALLQLARGFTIVEIQVEQGDWLADCTLASLELPREGVLVLGITKGDGSYFGAPIGSTKIRAGDVLTLYGKLERLDELNQRRRGVVGVFAKNIAVKKHKKEVAQEAVQAEVIDDGG